MSRKPIPNRIRNFACDNLVTANKQNKIIINTDFMTKMHPYLRERYVYTSSPVRVDSNAFIMDALTHEPSSLNEL